MPIVRGAIDSSSAGKAQAEPGRDLSLGGDFSVTGWRRQPNYLARTELPNLHMP
jgi:hypothetical protein